MTIDIILESDEEETFDGKHVWVHLSGEVDWAKKGCGFIYRNFRGAFQTKNMALKSLYSVLRFGGGEAKLEKDEANYTSYIYGNGREFLVKYNLEGPSIFDLNH
jgi:hypothetical protein